VENWTSIFILDAKGVIRFTPQQYFEAKSPDILDQTIEKLLKEMEK
jgi:hypothetical protein